MTNHQPLSHAHRRFYLYRGVDHTGISGTGVVALGVQFPDGTVALRWRGESASTAVWADMGAVLNVHGHNGATTAVWIDPDASLGTA